jgi:xanthine dehydrogenase accessory factor
VKTGALVVVRGGGDLGTGVAHRLHRSGYEVVILESESPRAVRRLVAFAEAVRERAVVVEGVEARLTALTDLPAGAAGRERSHAAATGGRGWIPVIVDPEGRSIGELHPDAIVDARMAKRNLGTTRGDAPLTIGLGPGFTAGADVDLVIETKRGHAMGRVVESGPALADTGVPGLVGGVGEERVIRSPAEGAFTPARAIGELVDKGTIVGSVGGEPVPTRTGGLIRGLVAAGLVVGQGDKIGDVDPRGDEVDPRMISDKARAVGGAVLEALLSRGVLPRRASSEAG